MTRAGLTTAASITHAVPSNAAAAACGAESAAGWGRLHPVYGSTDVTCPACQAVLTQRYMAAVPLNTGSEP